jgi:hypothetical protein
VATSASILDLLSADSVATREAAISAANLERLSAFSVSTAATYLNKEGSTSSRGSSRTLLRFIYIYQLNFPHKFYFIRAICLIFVPFESSHKKY